MKYITKICCNEIKYLIEDDLKRIWVMTDGGVNLYDHEKDIFYRNTNIKIPSVANVTSATQGKIWVATYAGGGLALVGPGINDVELFGEDKGMLHNDADDVVMDDLGQLWLPTQRGLSVFDTLTRTYTNFYQKDGYQKYGQSENVDDYDYADIKLNLNFFNKNKQKLVIVEIQFLLKFMLSFKHQFRDLFMCFF